MARNKINPVWIFAGVCLLCFLWPSSWLSLSWLWGSRAPSVSYAIMFDAGSTGSRIHVYTFDTSDPDNPLITDEIFEQLKPGLSSYVDDPAAAARSLEPLIQIAKRSIPESEWKCTPVALKATAGLRLAGATKAQTVLNEVTSYLKSTPFFLVPDGVEIMDGRDEAVFAWITVNYLIGRLHKTNKHSTAGVLDLGGGSTQIVFEPKSSIYLVNAPDYRYEFVYGSNTYILYFTSFLGYGLMEARKAALSAADRRLDGTGCLPPKFANDAFPRAAGKEADFEMCYEEVKNILNKNAICPLTPCAFNGVFMPAFDQFCDEIFALSYFYDRTDTFDTPFPPSFSIEEYRKYAERYCASDDVTIPDEPHTCLDLTYLYALLHDGYSFPDQAQVKLAKKIRDYETGWCLGAAMQMLDSFSGMCY